MKNSHTSSGWLSPRFWGVSFLFWAVYTGLQYLPAYFAYDNFKVLWLQSWPCVLYWLATPLLFECAYRLGRRGLSARGYYLGLFAAVLLAALFTTATFTAVYGPISVVVSMLVVYLGAGRVAGKNEAERPGQSWRCRLPGCARRHSGV
jgi:chromate transport protein ChrA